MGKPVFNIFKQQRLRSVFRSLQSDQGQILMAGIRLRPLTNPCDKHPGKHKSISRKTGVYSGIHFLFLFLFKPINLGYT